MKLDLAPHLATLRAGGVVACPTETQVGLLADALDPAAVAEVARLKGRADDAPMGVLLPDTSALVFVASPLGEAARRLADEHWPGPLTLVVPALRTIPRALVHDGKVGVRVPGPSAALDLARAFGGPLTATSANPTGQSAPVATADLDPILRAALDAVVEGHAGGGAPSTVVDVSRVPFRVIRPGPIVLA